MSLERASQFSIIFLVVVASVAIIDQRVSARRQPTRNNAALHLVGKKISIPSVSWDRTPTNVVVAMTTHCPYCASSMGFYRRLATAVQDASSKKTAVVFVSPEPRDTTSNYLDQLSIAPYKVVSVSLKDLEISGTPTLLLVDDTGQVKHAYAGKLSDTNETTVLNLIVDSLKNVSELR
jgi:thiol-disulfide isomerase/thioredoxin